MSDITDSKTVGLSDFPGVDDLVLLAQSAVELCEVEVGMFREVEGSYDVAFVRVIQQFLEPHCFHSFSKNCSILLVSVEIMVYF